MIYLHGFSISNYYNKIKFQLLEKGLPFEEVPTPPGSNDPAVLAASPLGKVPFVRCDGGTLCESAAIADWLEARHPEPRLLPADPWAAAKLREITIFLELHLELVARELYPQAFFGATLPEKFVARIGDKLERNVAAFRRLARFAPYLGSESFTLADCAGYVHLPLIALASKATLGRDLLAAHDIDWKGYVARIEQRPAAQQVAAACKADQARLAQLRAATPG